MGTEADPPEGNESFVYADFVAPMRGDELDCARRFVIADTYARFRRDRGDAVLFAPAIGTFGEEIVLEAARRGISPHDLADSLVDRLRQRCDLLGVSCDWTRSVVTSQPEHCRRAQRIFLELFERGLVYRREPPGDDRPWLLQRAAFAESCDRGLDELPGWTADAIEAQRRVLGRIEGVEIDAVLLGGGQVPVFTPYADSIGDSTFIAISPHHPEVQTVASPSDLEQLRNDPSPVSMAQTGMQAAIPGVDGLLPVVVTPSVDARFGPTLCLGIPDRDDTDREIAARLVTRPGLPFRTTRTSSKPRSAARFPLPDRPVSRIGEWGVPVPIVHCDGCGPLSADVEEASGGSKSQTGASETDSCRCPGCGEPAKRDRQVLDGRFDSMWAWLAIPVPPDDRGSSSLAHSELNRWLPARQAVWSAADAEQFLDERFASRAMSELGILPGLDPPEPFAGATLCGAVGGDEHGGVGSAEELDELAAREGPDVVRLTILHAASAPKPASWTTDSFRHSQRFLGELRDYAEPRLSSRELAPPLEIDGSARLRRRLSAWCRVAEVKVSASLEQLKMHRATYDLMLFLKRIRDFEERCVDAGELTPLDRDAVVVALMQLVRLASPCVPHIAAELEAIAGTEASRSLAAASDL